MCQVVNQRMSELLKIRYVTLFRRPGDRQLFSVARVSVGLFVREVVGKRCMKHRQPKTIACRLLPGRDNTDKKLGYRRQAVRCFV